MRCPACGALEPEAAAWCSQCLTRFGVAVPPGSTVPDASPTDAPRDVATSDPPADAPTPDAPTDASGGAPTDGGRDVRVVDGEVEWRCARCAAWTPLGARDCGRCGAPRRGFGDRPGPPVVAPERVRSLQLASVVLPGLGHLLAGRRVAGAARATVTVVWILAALRLLGGGGTGTATAAVLLLGVGVLDAATVVDAGRLHLPGAREVVTPRRLVWFALGVVVAAIATTLVTLPA